MKIQYTELLDQLKKDVQNNLEILQKITDFSEEELNRRSHEKSWSVLECLYHLNLYGEIYIPLLSDAIKKSDKTQKKSFKSGMIGNYFTKLLSPKNNIIKNPMPAPSDKNPIGSQLDLTVLEIRKQQLEELQSLLNQSEGLNLENIKIPISISRFIRLKTGDTFRFLIAHDARHFIQCQNIIIENVPNSNFDKKTI
ncbi:DinB family protein [Flammeovirga sp. MY04]|uniref:DinB family protein n=1 Tax=Flammeovirga sp. MY04 TaxID=1191459 RepID=UPI0008061BA0|nr:DinB family protein [Flammeovirga sp. MY04]ANQ48021.1 DinB family protein [Flammeovirga sp. MY04]